jgi:hypothetical protein
MCGRVLDNFMVNRAVHPMVSHFGERMNPDALAFAMLQVGAVLVIMRAATTGLIILGSEMTSIDVIGLLMVVLFMFGYILRSFQLTPARCSHWTIRANPVDATNRRGWVYVTMAALLFNLFFFFPGDILFTFDVVAFSCIALASYLQGHQSAVVANE